jgi:hypothetical protein
VIQAQLRRARFLSRFCGSPLAGGDFEGAVEAVEDGFGPAEFGGDAGGDFVPTGAGSGGEAVGVGDDLAGGEGLGPLPLHAVPFERRCRAVRPGGLGQVERGVEGGANSGS